MAIISAVTTSTSSGSTSVPNAQSTTMIAMPPGNITMNSTPRTTKGARATPFATASARRRISSFTRRS